MPTLTVKTPTIFKQEPSQARDLSADQRLPIEMDATFELLAHSKARAKHLKCTFGQELGSQNKNTWYVFSEHVELLINNPEGDESESQGGENSPRIDGFQLPGYQSTFYLGKPILANGNFTWAEATKNGTRIPVSKKIVQNILRIADTMEEIRALFGDRPITVTSWYRDPVSNRRVGGASRSQHLTGGAVDFVIAGVRPSEVQRRLDPWWGSKGGLASANTFTHIDQRGGGRFRWKY